MKTTKRQTAGNNTSLRAIKAWMNASTYRRALHLMNTEGPEAVREHLCRFFRPEVQDKVDAIMAGKMP